MKILYVQPGQGVGGSKESLYQIIKALPGAYERQVVLDSLSDTAYNERIQPYVSACHLLHLPTWQKYHRLTFFEHIRAPLGDAWRLLKCIATAFKIARIIKHEEIDLVHTNNSMSPSGALAAWLSGVPHIWHVREPVGRNRQYPLLLGNYSLRLMQKLSRSLICNSDYTAEVFRVMRIPVQVMLNGLDLPNFETINKSTRDIRNAYQIASDVCLVGMVGNLTTVWKRHDVFLDIAALILKTAPRTRFIIFGGSANLEQTEYTRSLQRKANSLELTDHLIWANYEDDIPGMMNAMDIVIHPAVTEGSGRVVMEAMACGKPVVAFRSGGVKELIDDGVNGFLVEPTKPERAAEVTLRLLRDATARAIIGAAAREYAINNFCTDTMIERLIDLYRVAVRRE